MSGRTWTRTRDLLHVSQEVLAMTYGTITDHARSPACVSRQIRRRHRGGNDLKRFVPKQAHR